MFKKPPTLEETVKKWKRDLKHEERNIEKSIRDIDVEEAKVKKSIKERLKQGDKNSARTLAKELVRSRKAKERLYTSKAQLNSVVMQLQSNMAMVRMSKTMQKSTQIMGAMNNLVKMPQLQKVMMAMSKEMAKSGLIEEMMDDVFEDADVDEEADEEIDKVVEELTMGLKTVTTPNQPLPTGTKTEDMSELEQRLGALKG